jgi:hypothetical protein
MNNRDYNQHNESTSFDPFIKGRSKAEEYKRTQEWLEKMQNNKIVNDSLPPTVLNPKLMSNKQSILNRSSKSLPLINYKNNMVNKLNFNNYNEAVKHAEKIYTNKISSRQWVYKNGSLSCDLDVTTPSFAHGNIDATLSFNLKTLRSNKNNKPYYELSYRIIRKK